MNKTERIHSLDALRAIMMILGIVLHSSETYNLGRSTIWPKDPVDTHLFFNYLSSIIHIFRMPIFFVIAGFFGAMLYDERGPVRMIKNRISRIVLPFVVFLLVLNPVITFAARYTTDSFKITLSALSTEFTLIPGITYHLWFLYYLILLTFSTFLLADLLKRVPFVTRLISVSFQWILKRRLLNIILFFIIIFILLVWMWNTWAPTPLDFAVDFKVFLFYLFFYLFGWLLFKSRELLNSFMKNDWLFTILGFLIYTSKFLARDYISDVLYGTLNALVVWLFVFGITGLFLRYASIHSKRMRYISDSSYWVYLIHLPLTLFIPGVIVDWPIPVLLKFLIVMTLTTVICFSTYHYLVRGTFIGKFLNGRKYPIKVSSDQAV